jgi:cobalt/nickel transport system permease protein
MSNIQYARANLRFLEDQSVKDTPIHRLHPMIKVLTTLVYLGVIISYEKYEIIAMLPLLFYPLVQFSLADLPARLFFKQLLIAAPFVIGIGIFNPLLDPTPRLVMGPLTVSGGWISFGAILFKFALTVLAALQLIATTGLNEMGAALLKCKIPRAFVTQLLLVYRYLTVLVEETAAMIQAYSLRTLENRGIGVRAWGSLVGHLLLRTMDRAERIYQAMLCRGFAGELQFIREYRLGFNDIAYLLGWSVFFVAARFYNIPEWLGRLMMGVGR